MSSRSLIAGSLVAFVVLAAVLVWRTGEPATQQRPLIVWTAPAVRVPLEAIARDYEVETGRKVELRFGASEDILTRAGMVNSTVPADLFFPADSSYIQLARERGLVTDSFPVATMKIVVLTAPGNPKKLAAWPDLLRPDVKVAVPNPAAAVGKIARDHLAATGKWAALQPRAIDTGTVTEAANAAKIGSVDAAIVWDAVAFGYAGQTALILPEFEGVTARVEVAILKQSADPAAASALVKYLMDPAHGLNRFRAAGFRVIE